MSDILAAILASALPTLLIYAALDHIDTLKKRPKVQTGLKVALFFFAIMQTVYQYRTIVGAQKQSREDRESNRAIVTTNQHELAELKAEIKQARLELKDQQIESQEKIQSMRMQLAKSVSEAQLRAVQTEFSDWAESFATNAQDRAASLNKLKYDVKQIQADEERQARDKENQGRAKFSAEVYPATYYAVHCIQDMVRAYAKRTGESIQIDEIDLPDNFFAKDVEGQIKFPSGAVWSLKIHADKEPLLSFTVTFTDQDKSKTGELITTVNGQHQFGLDYSATLPVPDPATIWTTQDLSKYETPIKRAFQRVLATQLLYTLPKKTELEFHH